MLTTPAGNCRGGFFCSLLKLKLKDVFGHICFINILLIYIRMF